MRQLMRGERAAVSQLAAINHLWEVEVSIQAPVYIVDFCCLGLDENGEVFDDEFVIHLNRPDAPRGAIQLNNASNNGAVFSLALEELPPRVRRLVFTASVGENPIPGGLVGAAFSLFGVNADIGPGHIILATPAVEVAFFEFSGGDFADERTLVIGEFYLRDEWRFVAAGQPLKGELDTFLRTLTDGPTPTPQLKPVPQRAAPPLLAPARPARPSAPNPARSAPRPASAPVLTPPRAPKTPPAPIPAPRRNPGPLSTAPATILVPPAPAAAPTAAPIPAPVAAPVPTPNFPQSVPPGGTLQDLIDAAAPGAVLILQRGEYAGPITINKPLDLEGQGSAIWAKSGPLVTLSSPGATLHDLDLEITVSSAENDARGVALLVTRADLPLQLDGVQLRGRIAGIGAGDGVWQVPPAFDLGDFAARAINEWVFEVEVPVAATLFCSVGGLEISPSKIEAGAHEITLRARDIAPDTLLVGQIEVRAASVVFAVALRGNAQNYIEAVHGLKIG